MQCKLMQIECGAFPKFQQIWLKRLYGSDFDVFARLRFELLLQHREHIAKNFAILDQECSMIGKRNRDQPSAGKPRIDSAEQQTVLEFHLGRRTGICNRLVAISEAKCFKPAGSVKDRSVGSAAEKSEPALIYTGIEAIYIKQFLDSISSLGDSCCHKHCDSFEDWDPALAADSERLTTCEVP